MKKLLKERIVEFLLGKVEEKRAIGVKTKVVFTKKELCEHLDDEYPISVTRELRALKQSGRINYFVTDKFKGEYRLLLNVPVAGSKKKTILDEMNSIREKLESKTVRSDAERMLDDVRNRRLQKTSSKPS